MTTYKLVPVELIEQLIACHEEPTCPAVQWAIDVLAAPTQPEVQGAALIEGFYEWWDKHGQYCRAGGGQYEKTFAFRAWEAALAATKDQP